MFSSGAIIFFLRDFPHHRCTVVYRLKLCPDVVGQVDLVTSLGRWASSCLGGNREAKSIMCSSLDVHVVARTYV